MRTPYGLEIIESCLICPLRHDRIFCDLPLQELEALQAMSSLATYPKGSVLFVEGQEARGVFILCNGRVKLSAGSADGKSLIMRIAAAAQVEFQKILDHSGVVGNQSIGAFAHLGLARAYALEGDTPKARAAYVHFLTLWKNADADVPILKEAKAEYAKVQ